MARSYSRAMKNPGVSAPIRDVGTVIHRDKTFEHDGRRYMLIQGGPQWGYEIVTMPELRYVADGLFTLAEVRKFVDDGFLDALVDG